MKKTFLKNITGPAIAGIILSATPIVFTSLLTYYAIVYERIIAGFTSWQWVLITLICTLTSAGLTPPTMLALIFGYFLGWQAVLPLFVINLGGILFINLLVRWFDHDRFLAFIQQNPKAQSVLGRILNNELEVIFYAKLSPILPFGLTNLVFALSGAKLRNILLGGFLGMTPRTLLAIWSGHEAHAIKTLLENPNQSAWTQIIVIGLVVVSIVGLWHVIQKSLK
ncbi:TVP38/TMEM64 family protein [Spirosoma koreense]